MFRHQLPHAILEFGRRFGVREFDVVGPAAILAALPDPPVGAFTAARDVGVIPLGDDEQLAGRISFVLGEAHDFDAAHGYYAQGVSAEIPRYAPRDWTAGALPIRVAEFTAWSMEPADLVLGKLGAGREQDLDFARSAARLELAPEGGLLDRPTHVAGAERQRTPIADRSRPLFHS
jgi:hypothetical protein